MTRKLALIVALLLSCFDPILAQPKTPARPKLVVGIVVDQMRWDYLYRYYDRYGNTGFRRLLKDGYSCEQTYIDYLPSYTAPGHACIYTGSVPSIHGIAGNDWIDNATGRNWYCVEDTTVSPVGGSQRAGRMSPRTLLASTITDELKLATNMRSKVYGIALKDRGSILPAGHLANGAYWYDDSTGSLVSSSYYGASLPAWLVSFNQKHLPDSIIRKDWQTLYPVGTYTQSISDDNPYEGLFRGETKPVFPHNLVSSLGYGNLRRVPAGNTYSFQAAISCIAAEQMGKAATTDFLCLSLSTPDYIGHQFAPNSVEVEDQYLRLDKDLGDFLAYLDGAVGKGLYIVFLTADHGGAHNVNYMKSLNLEAGDFPEARTGKMIDSFLTATFGQSSLIRSIENYQVVLNEDKIRQAGIDRNLVKRTIRDWLLKRPGIAYIADMEDLNSSAIPAQIREMIINGYNRNRSGSLVIILNPGWYAGFAPTGTTHGTWHPYDSHIPLLWYGWGINKGISNRRVHMQDIAATLAALLKVQVPNGCIGSVIEGVIR